ncbi:hypothetical protein D3C77_744320 [compost metagenome]
MLGVPGQGQVQIGAFDQSKQFGVTGDPDFEIHPRVSLDEASQDIAQEMFPKVLLKPKACGPGGLAFMQGLENTVVQLQQPAGMAE